MASLVLRYITYSTFQSYITIQYTHQVLRQRKLLFKFYNMPMKEPHYTLFKLLRYMSQHEFEQKQKSLFVNASQNLYPRALCFFQRSKVATWSPTLHSTLITILHM